MIEAVELANANGVTVRLLTLGATIQSLIVPDRDGNPADVVLGYDDAEAYIARPQFFGSTVGRYANRIARGQFELDGAAYELETNDGPNHLHGGTVGFDKVNWKLESAGSSAVVLSYISPDGEGGYPGELHANVAYRLNDQNELTIEFSATTDKPTIVNMTNHSYFNLTGVDNGRDVLGHKLTLDAEQFTPTDKGSIPTGELRAVEGTPFDFRKALVVGARIDGPDDQLAIGNGYDHNFVVSGAPGELRRAARLEDPESGRAMDVFTTAPGVQFYTGNSIDGGGKRQCDYRPRQALCLEPQAFPDTPNQPAFGSARLNPGDTYRHTMVLKFSTVDSDDQEN